ncbi:unnamed protein product [Sympodiomycopsis kandeliae]
MPSSKKSSKGSKKTKKTKSSNSSKSPKNPKAPKSAKSSKMSRSSKSTTSEVDLVLSPTTGQILQRLGLSADLFTIKASQNPTFPTQHQYTQQEKKAWSCTLRGADVIDRKQVKLGDVVVFSAVGEKKRKRDGKKAQKENSAQVGIVRSLLSNGEEFELEKAGQLRDILGSAARWTDLYRTGKIISVKVDQVSQRLLPSSYRLQLKHDEEHPCWLQDKLHDVDEQKATDDFYKPKSSTWSHKGAEYHVLDCMMLQSQSGMSFKLVQIQEFNLRDNSKLEIYLQELVPCRTGVRVPVEGLVQVSRHGSMFLLDWNQWKVCRKEQVSKGKPPGNADITSTKLRYYTPDPKFKTCEKSEKKAEQAEKETEKALSTGLRAMGLFSGAGGEVQGFAFDGFVRTTCAIDLDPLCGLTMKTTDDQVVYIQEDLITLVRNILSGQPLPPGLPPPSSIDVITASPPCQGFSKANFNRSKTDSRNLLVAVSLAMIELYKPSYVMMENVVGMLEPGMQIGNQTQGYVKLILLTLIELGYSVRLVDSQSASFGTPSYRHRIIILASKDRPLPSMPEASHEHERGIWQHLNLFPKKNVSLQYKSQEESVDEQIRKFYNVKLPRTPTLGEAIADLSSWDWKDPHELYSDVPASKIDQIKQDRKKQIFCFDAHHQNRTQGTSWQRCACGPHRTQYKDTSVPGQEYRSLMKKDNHGHNHPVTQHQTIKTNSMTAERVTNVPFNAGASAYDFTSRAVNKPLLLSKDIREETGNLDAEDFRAKPYERSDGSKPFPTILTRPTFAGRLCAWIHPNDARILSIREVARVQGFPDHVVFGGKWYSTVEDMTPSEAYKQIGNSVPPLLARAVGRAFAKSHIQWCKEQKHGSHN